MRTPSSSELLDAWDEGAGLPNPERATTLLRSATRFGPGELESLPVGEVNRLLLQLRRRLFGDRLETVVECPGCGLALEVGPSAAALLEERAGPEAVDVTLDGYRVRCREPSARDLADAAATGSVRAARLLLITRAVLSVELDGVVHEPAALPDAVVAAAGEALAAADPLLDVEFRLACEECGRRWSSPFDIGAFLWQELDAWAARTLEEVHALASTYGWRESDVLALSQRRRRHYLGLVGHG